MAQAMKPQLSDREIAKHCGVGHEMVGATRCQLAETASCTAPAVRIGADGKERRMPRSKEAIDAMRAEAMKPQLSDREIAKHCGVGADMVSNIRNQVSLNDTYRQKTRIGGDGKTYPVKPNSNDDLPQNSAEGINEADSRETRNIIAKAAGVSTPGQADEARHRPCNRAGMATLGKPSAWRRP